MRTIAAICFMLSIACSITFGQGVTVPTMQDLEAAKYNDSDLRGRIEVIEKAISELGNKVPDPTDPEVPPIDPEEPEVPDPEPTDPEPTDPEEPSKPVDHNAHFNALVAHPNHVYSMSLRDPAHYLFSRSGRPYVENPFITYDSELDAAKVLISAIANELDSKGRCQFNWSKLPWNVGDSLVIQHEIRFSKDWLEDITAKGDNGRATTQHKVTNLTVDGKITYETRGQWGFLGTGLFDMRIYPGTREGRVDREHIASDIADPTRTFSGSGGNYDRHTGPDSTYPYVKGDKPLRHPQTFRLTADTWVRWTYELKRVEEGMRIRLWAADENHGPSLIIASPSDSSIGFLCVFRPIDGWYLELDTSQEAEWDEDNPQDDRPVWFRNLAVINDIDGESVLGGRPNRVTEDADYTLAP